MIADSRPTVSTWIGRLISAFVVLVLLADAASMLFMPATLAAEMESTGFAPGSLTPLGILVVVCAVLYALPRTAVLGAILVTGFLGGAICTHFRIGEIGSPPQLVCLALGLLTWGGLYLRSPALRRLLPVSA